MPDFLLIGLITLILMINREVIKNKCNQGMMLPLVLATVNVLMFIIILLVFGK